MKFELRDYQKTAVAQTLSYFRSRREPAVVVLPTGAGKSLVIAELARIAKGRVLILAHVKELVEQNYEKYKSYGLSAGIFSASLNQKDWYQKAIFGSVQSVARAPDEFFKDFTLLVIDECHRVSEDGETQYQEVVEKLKKNNSDICVLGLTATPFRLDTGWIFKEDAVGELKTDENRFFAKCVYDLPLSFMIRHQFLTPPVKVDIPVTCYDFSDLNEENGRYSDQKLNEILHQQKNLTPFIVKNIIDISERMSRKGVMVFSSTVMHAEEIMSYLPKEEARCVLGDTKIEEREKIVQDFKGQKFKYLVNVSVLTTGFDAPHVDVIAILRPTESTSLYQQIIGRGLRLDTHKKDCLILDYTGMGHNIYSPEIRDRRPSEDADWVEVECPQCLQINIFWGRKDENGSVWEHFGRKCQNMILSPQGHLISCGYRFRFKICSSCGAENDLASKQCQKCKENLVAARDQIKMAKLSKGMHVLQVDRMELFENQGKRGPAFLEVRYYDLESQYVSEAYFFEGEVSRKKFFINFLRSHLRRSELAFPISNIQEALKYKLMYRSPAFVIARKQERYWRVTEKIFSEEL